MAHLIAIALCAGMFWLTPCLGHGTLTWPNSSRVNGSLETAGACTNDSCTWYSDFVTIPGEPTLNSEIFRTVNVHVSSGSKDWSGQNPWRAPGTASVFGSGCGIMGGSATPTIESSGSFAPNHWPAGTDGASLPAMEPTEWKRGAEVEVGFALTANHGGGYSYRLCPKNETVSEECFQRQVLRFAGDKHWLQYGALAIQSPMPRYEIPRLTVTEGTHPPGSEWAQNPIPTCLMFDRNECTGLQGDELIQCAQFATGYGLVQCPPNMTEFEAPLPGLSGHVPSWNSQISPDIPQWSNVVAPVSGLISMGFPFSIIDKVVVPEHLLEGDYLLSWRWDCEQSTQVWQNCADIRVVANNDMASQRGLTDAKTKPGVQSSAEYILP